MNRAFGRTLSLALLLIIGMLACGGEMPQQKHQEGTLEKMIPKKEDKLSTLMDRCWDNLTYLLYGFINFDKEKVKTSVTNFVKMSPYMAQRIGPQHIEYKKEWNEQCNRQQEIAGALGRQIEENNYEEGRNSLHELIENCMECHKVYRKHLLKSAEEESAK